MNRVFVWSKRLLLALIALLLLAMLGAWLFLRASLAQLDGTRQAPGQLGKVTITRDAMGVPTFTAENRADLPYALGYVHAQERFFQMDLLRRSAAGELSELFGAKAVDLDKSHRLHRFRARATSALGRADADERMALQRYTEGVNAGLQALGARPFEYALIGMAPRAWTPEDTLLAVWAMYFDLQGNIESRELTRGWLQDHSTPEQLAFLLPASTRWDAPLDAEAIDQLPPIPAKAPDWWNKTGTPPNQRVALLKADLAVGSNNSAVAGSRSDTGGAIVSDDMHLGIMLPNTWFRAVLQYPDGQGGQRRIVGATLPGTPAVAVGSNGKVAWGFTNSYGDYLDLLRVETRDGKVRMPDGWVQPTQYAETILVKGAAAVQYVVAETPLGPIRKASDKEYIVHWTAHLPGAVDLHLQALEGAKDVDEALHIAAGMGLPAQNFTVGDAAGHIGWTVAGPIPVRGHGSDSTFPLNVDDASAQWQGWLAPDQHPQVKDPQGAQLWTANSRQLTGPGAALIGDGGFDIGARAHQLRDRLRELGPKTDVTKTYQAMLDDRAIFLQPWRDRAIKVLEAAGTGDARQVEALKLLKTTWTGHASTDSVAYRITRGFMWEIYERLFNGVDVDLRQIDDRAGIASATARWPDIAARLLDEQPAGWLPQRYKSWQELQLDAMNSLIAQLTANGKPLAQATWGQRNTMEIAHPIAKAVPVLARWLSAPPDQLPGDNHMPRVAGKTFGQSERMTVTPGKEDQGLWTMPGGQSGHPLSPYFLAGHADWAAGRALALLPGPTQHTLTLTP